MIAPSAQGFVMQMVQVLQSSLGLFPRPHDLLLRRWKELSGYGFPLQRHLPLLSFRVLWVHPLSGVFPRPGLNLVATVLLASPFDEDFSVND